MTHNNAAISEHYRTVFEALAVQEADYERARSKEKDIRRWIRAMLPHERRDFVLAAVTWLQCAAPRTDVWHYWPVHEAMLRALQCDLPFTHDDIVLLIDWSLSQSTSYHRAVPELLKIFKQYLSNHQRTPLLQAKLEELALTFASDALTGYERLIVTELLEFAGFSMERLLLIPGEAWTDAALADISAMHSEQHAAWSALLQACQKATGGKPTAKWLKQTQPLLEQIGFAAFKQVVLRWFPLVDKPRTQLRQRRGEWEPDLTYMLIDINADILRALVCLCAQREDQDIARVLAALATSVYRSVPGVGRRSVRVGNTCVWALGAMPGRAVIGPLAVLKLKIKFGTAQKAIEKALATAAERVGMSRAEIEELAVPAYGLQQVGVRREQVGSYTAELIITGTNTTELRWINADGKTQTSVPKTVKEAHADLIKELNAAAKDMRAMLPAQRDRIERVYAERKTWDFAAWRERYLDHPLVGTLVRRLLWQFRRGDQTVTGVWHNEQIVGRNGTPIAWLDEHTEVELWHPLHAATDEVLAWRAWLAEREIVQPFKQAYREVYLLTDAERRTRVYSNRFAAHVIKQHQFNALCGARGWKNQLRLMVDAEFPPATRMLASWGLRAEFWIEGIGDNYITDTNETGTYLRLATDQVRFYPLHAAQHYAHAGGGGYGVGRRDEQPEPLPLEQVPPIVFSEIMRDVDLFVGVASVGNDPTWADGGPAGWHRDYWNSYSWGNLGETAKTRRDVLERLLPRFPIAKRCEIKDRFLVVRGDLRTYKIHLGSGNILMEPNDQYLCIVPGRGAGSDGTGGKVFLPFEGDQMLSIIVSKALLLSNDTAITDPTITRQIKR